MLYENIENRYIVEVTNDALANGGPVVTYREVLNGHCHALCREWFTKWFMEAPEPNPRWTMTVGKTSCGEFWKCDLFDDGKACGSMVGFRHQFEAKHAAERAINRMNPCGI